MFVNWIVSTIPKHHSYNQRDVAEIQSLIWHICSNLLAAGVMKQIIDKDAPLQDSFCVCEYFNPLTSSKLNFFSSVSAFSQN